MVYDNPLRPSGNEVFDVGTVVQYKDPVSDATYEYLGCFDGAGEHVMRDRRDGILYETHHPEDYKEYIEAPEAGSRWRRGRTGQTVIVKGVVDFDDGAGPYVCYCYADGVGASETDRPRFLRKLALWKTNFNEAA